MWGGIYAVLFSVSTTEISDPITEVAYKYPSGPKMIPLTPAISAPLTKTSSLFSVSEQPISPSKIAIPKKNLFT